MNSPRFSVVIPTRNRPTYAADALTSVLLQDFSDVEIIVSDNSTDSELAGQLASFVEGTPAKYIRPPRDCAMPDHWEFATRTTKGQYVLVLSDRSVLKANALRTIHESLAREQDRIGVCSWTWSMHDEKLGVELRHSRPRMPKEISVVRSEDVSASVGSPSGTPTGALPRGLNSCYRADLADSIRAKHGTLFRRLNPDFTSAFLLLAEVEHMLYIDRPLFISTGLGVSNGGVGYITESTSYLNSLELAEPFPSVPIKSPLVENSIFEDFLAMRQLAGGHLAGVEFDWVNYFRVCYSELMVKKGHGLLEPARINGFFSDWQQALAAADPQVQQAVRRQLRRSPMMHLLPMLRSSWLGPHLVSVKRRLKSCLDRQGRRGRISALEAAGFTGRAS
ncbi:MAG: glycosyltransferase family 2 protein [Planctomycetaceae bacterium]|nr:glycosyltransferase family 2 protein [Planctomycetaceae bacterium]